MGGGSMSRVLGMVGRLGLVLGALAGPAVPPADAQFLPEIPKVPVPGSGQPLPPPTPGPVRSQLLPAPNPIPTPIDTLTNLPSPPAMALPPLPGSLADEYAKELQAREEFTTYTPEGNRFRFLPNTLLWEPPLAVKKDPRLQIIVDSLKNYRSNFTVDTSIGGTVGLFRWDLEGRDAQVQLDIFGLVISRLTPDDLMADDYRFGFPLTFRRGWWSGKIAYEHTSAHLGDETQQALGLTTRSFAKDELVLGLSRILYNDLRIYGHAAYAFGFQVPDVETTTGHRSRADIGFEYYKRCATGFAGTPFVAGNFEWRGDQQGETNITLQVGWLWKNPYQRFGNARVFAEYYRGRSPYGQFIQNRETFGSVGFGFDY